MKNYGKLKHLIYFQQTYQKVNLVQELYINPKGRRFESSLFELKQKQKQTYQKGS